jgi:hypothetical protein
VPILFTIFLALDLASAMALLITFLQFGEGADYYHKFPCENCTSNILKYFKRRISPALLQNCPLGDVLNSDKIFVLVDKIYKFA